MTPNQNHDPKATWTFSQEQLRLCFVLFVIFLLFTALGVQLWRIQISNGQRYEDKAMSQSVRKIRIPPIRGKIWTSDGHAIASNGISWDVILHPSDMRKSRRKDMIDLIHGEAERIAKCIGRTNPLTKKKIEWYLRTMPGYHIDLFQDLTNEERMHLWELIPRVTGMELVRTPVRTYPDRNMAVHVLGYTRKGDPNDADDRREYNYYVPDPVGKEGIERELDELLRGSAGQQLVMVNSAGFVCEQLEISAEARNGSDVHLTLDYDAQRIAELLMANRVGAFVVMDASNGAIRAMVSAPSFYPDLDFKDVKRYQALNKNPDKPFLNRATMGTYIPGSVIKPLTALACLENGIDEDETVNCTGHTKNGNARGINCSSRYGHGYPVDVKDALKVSCNVYFVDNAVRIGIDPLSAMFKSAGIGQPTGIDIPERSGFLPKNTDSWSSQDTAYVGFGQGKINVTPLQVVNYFAALANGGVLWQPYLIDYVSERDPEGRDMTIRQTRPRIRGHLAASQHSLEVVKEGLYRVVNTKRGSGRLAKIEKTIIYGKTGTADFDSTVKPQKYVWFAGFAENPVTHKTYSVAVMLEHGESGGTSCAPLVGQFFNFWFPEPPAEAVETDDDEQTDDADTAQTETE